MIKRDKNKGTNDTKIEWQPSATPILKA